MQQSVKQPQLYYQLDFQELIRSAQMTSFITLPKLEKPQQLQTKTKKTHFSQSELHNCPKHLIKIIFQSLKIAKNYEKFMKLVETEQREVKIVFTKLIKLFELCCKNVIPGGISRMMLKIIFEQNAENINRFKLFTQNNLVRETFVIRNNQQEITHLNRHCIAKAKSIFRQIAKKQLLANYKNLIQTSKFINKTIITRYIEDFMRQLEDGHISERMIKIVKNKILEPEF